MADETEEWLANALFLGCCFEVKMYQSYDSLIGKLPAKWNRQIASIRMQEAKHLALSAQAVESISSNPLLLNKNLYSGREKELTKLVGGTKYLELLEEKPKTTEELLDYIYEVESYYEETYVKLLPRIRLPAISNMLLTMVNESRSHARTADAIRKEGF